jgi:hypothetical protein
MRDCTEAAVQLREEGIITPPRQGRLDFAM